MNIIWYCSPVLSRSRSMVCGTSCFQATAFGIGFGGRPASKQGPDPLVTSSHWLKGSTLLNIQIIELDGPAIEGRLNALSQILTDSVAEGAAIGFMAPLSYDDAAWFWSREVEPQVIAGRRVLFGATDDDNLLGTVQLIMAMPPNQPHRCEIAKMIVHPRARRLGIGRSLMNHALHRARELGKTLVTLDTRTGDVGEPLYASVGFEVAGLIPDFAWNPDGKARHATTYMFRRI